MCVWVWVCVVCGMSLAEIETHMTIHFISSLVALRKCCRPAVEVSPRTPCPFTPGATQTANDTHRHAHTHTVSKERGRGREKLLWCVVMWVAATKPNQQKSTFQQQSPWLLNLTRQQAGRQAGKRWLYTVRVIETETERQAEQAGNGLASTACGNPKRQRSEGPARRQRRWQLTSDREKGREKERERESGS